MLGSIIISWVLISTLSGRMVEWDYFVVDSTCILTSNEGIDRVEGGKNAAAPH